MNMTKTAMLIALMTVMFMSIGYLLGGGGGMMIALVIAVAMNLFGYWNSDKWCCACTMRRKWTSAAHPNITVW